MTLIRCIDRALFYLHLVRNTIVHSDIPEYTTFSKHLVMFSLRYLQHQRFLWKRLGSFKSYNISTRFSNFNSLNVVK